MYEDVYKSLHEKLSFLQSIREDIDNDMSEYTEENTNEVLSDVQFQIKVSVINALPSYFQSLRNDIAQKIRNISVAVFNSLNDSEEALKILSYAKQLKISSLTKMKIDEDFEQIKEIDEERKETEKYGPDLEKYANVIVKIVSLTKQVEAKQITPPKVKSSTSRLFSIKSLNALPEIFDEIRDQIALGLRNLSVSVWNVHQDISVAIGLIEQAQKISVSWEIKDQLTEALDQLEELQVKLYEPIINSLKEINKTINDTLYSTRRSIDKSKLKSLIDQILPRELIIQISKADLDTIVSFLNEFNKILSFIGGKYALSKIEALRSVFHQKHPARDVIDQLYEKYKPRPVTASSVAKQTAEAGGGCLVSLGMGLLNLILRIGAVVIFVGIMAFATDTCSSYSNSNSYSDFPTSSNDYSPRTPTQPPEINTPSAESTEREKKDFKPVEDPPTIKTSKYKGNQLKTGASPLDDCFGKGKYRETNSWLLFKNSNQSDAIVCLVDTRTGSTIRNEYIQAGKNFKMTKLPNGTFYLKVFYGNDWNPSLVNGCGTKGAFETNAHFSVSDSPSDYITVEDNGYSYSTGEITLYTVQNGNMQQRNISESNFFQ
jgi:hypothetical protein